MSDSKPILSSENVPTIAAVAVILGLLAISHGVYLHRQLLVVAVGTTALDARAGKADDARDKELADLKARLAALEQHAAAPPVTAGAAAEVAAAPAPQ
jgi:hypothetical protein